MVRLFGMNKCVRLISIKLMC